MLINDLFQALYRGDKTSVKKLIQQGVNLRFRFRHGNIDEGILKMALNAARAKRFEIGMPQYFGIIELLLQNSADPNETFKKAVLSNAEQNDNNALDTVNIQVPVFGEVLWSTYPPSYLTLFIKYGVDLNKAVDAYQNTPLHQCIQLGSFEKAKLLLEHGANPNIPDTNQYTPLMSAIEAGELNDKERIEMIRYLVRHKDVDLTLKNDDGKTARHIAHEKNDPTTIALIDSTIARQKAGAMTRYPRRFHKTPDKYQSYRDEREVRLHRVVRFR